MKQVMFFALVLIGATLSGKPLWAGDLKIPTDCGQVVTKANLREVKFAVDRFDGRYQVKVTFPDLHLLASSDSKASCTSLTNDEKTVFKNYFRFSTEAPGWVEIARDLTGEVVQRISFYDLTVYTYTTVGSHQFAIDPIVLPSLSGEFEITSIVADPLTEGGFAEVDAKLNGVSVSRIVGSSSYRR